MLYTCCTLNWSSFLLFVNLFRLEKLSLIKGISEHTVLLLHLVLGLSLNPFILSTAILLVSKKQHAPLPSLLPFKNITDLNFLVGMIWEKNQNQNFRAYTLNLHFYVLILINIIFFNLLYRHYGKYFLPGSSKSSSNLITQKVKDTSACPTMLSWKEYRILSNLTNKKYPVFYILWSISVTFWICLSVIFLTAALTKDKNFV